MEIFERPAWQDGGVPLGSANFAGFEKLREQDTRIDDQEQYIRRECLEIKGISYIEDVDTTKLVKSVAELAGVEINDEDISISLPAAG